MSHIRHYRVLPWATGPLTFLESIAEVPDRRVTKTGKSSIFWLSSFFLSSVSVTVSQASTITAKAITTIQMRKKKQHKSQGIALTTYCYCRTQTILQWFPSTPMLVLSTVRHFARIKLFIETTVPSQSSTEHMFRELAYWTSDGNSQSQVYSMTQNIET